jgi:hypothetical protein
MSGPLVGSSSVALAPAVSGGGTNGAAGIWGLSDTGYGVSGDSTSGTGVRGQSQSSDGVYGTSASGEGVYGVSASSNGVHGVNGAGNGVTPKFGCGVRGESDNGYGVYAGSKTSDGVHADSASQSASAVAGINSAGGTGIYGGSSGNAGKFDGNVAVTGNITVTGTVTSKDVVLVGSDCAEDFDIANAGQIEPGTVVVFDGEGAISQSSEPYNKRVAGVISGAGKFRPGVVLGRDGSSAEGKAPVALMGRVYCKVDASYSPIEAGDMLTTSPTSGFAMKASDPSLAFGAVIGKALASHKDGHGLIPILVSLQ